MSTDTQYYNELKEATSGLCDEKVHTNAKDFAVEVANLSDEDLSLNLLPLGKLVAESGHAKYTILLSEAGKRLAENGSDYPTQEETEEVTEYLPLNTRAKATILHALDNYIATGSEQGVSDGCTHFDNEVNGAPTKDEVLNLIELIEESDGLATAYEETAILGEVVPVQEAQAQADAVEAGTPVFSEHPLFSASGITSVIEALSGQALTEESAEKLVQGFGVHLATDLGQTPEEVTEATSFIRTGLFAEIAKRKKRFDEESKELITERYGAFNVGTIAQTLVGFAAHLRTKGFTDEAVNKEITERTKRLYALL